MSPFLYDRLKRFGIRVAEVRKQKASRLVPADSMPGAISYDAQVELKLNLALLRAQASNEADLRTLFLRDLDGLLCLADVGPNDHVYLPTAHGREGVCDPTINPGYRRGTFAHVSPGAPAPGRHA